MKYVLDTSALRHATAPVELFENLRRAGHDLAAPAVVVKELLRQFADEKQRRYARSALCHFSAGRVRVLAEAPDRASACFGRAPSGDPTAWVEVTRVACETGDWTSVLQKWRDEVANGRIRMEFDDFVAGKADREGHGEISAWGTRIRDLVNTTVAKTSAQQPVPLTKQEAKELKKAIHRELTIRKYRYMEAMFDFAVLAGVPGVVERVRRDVTIHGINAVYDEIIGPSYQGGLELGAHLYAAAKEDWSANGQMPERNDIWDLAIAASVDDDAILVTAEKAWKERAARVDMVDRVIHPSELPYSSNERPQ